MNGSKRGRTAILLCAIAMTALMISVPLRAQGSTGIILINTISSPSQVGQSIAVGGKINLYLGAILGSDQFSLYISSDSLSQLSAGDLPVGQSLSGNNVYASSITGGTWQLGYGWANGTLPTNVAGGNYYIKACVGTTVVAVTDTYVVITPILTSQPTQVPGGGPFTLYGAGFPGDSYVTLYYYDSIYGDWEAWDSVETNSTGQFTYSASVPDLDNIMPAGDNPEQFYPINFGAVGCNGFWAYASMDEFYKGLTQVAGQTAMGLFGDNTDLTSSVKLSTGESFTISGKWFHPGPVTVCWDNYSDTVGAGYADSTGAFTANIITPLCSLGPHSLLVTDTSYSPPPISYSGSTVENSPNTLSVEVDVASALTLSPSSGYSGNSVEIAGAGFNPSVGQEISKVTLYWGEINSSNIVASAVNNQEGSFNTTFIVPQDEPGIYNITACYSGSTTPIASTSFQIDISKLTISPSTVTIISGESVSFSATAYDSSGNSWNVTNQASWTILNNTEDGGSWSGSVYTSYAAGDYTVQATCLGCTSTASMIVNHGPPEALYIVGSSSSVVTGQKVIFDAIAYDADGNSWDVSSATSWSISSDAGGLWSGDTYTVGNAGSWTVTATYSGLEANTQLDVFKVNDIPKISVVESGTQNEAFSVDNETTFAVDIRIDNASDLWGWFMNISWTPGILELLNVTEGPFLQQGGPTLSLFLPQLIDNAAGTVDGGLVDTLESENGVYGSGVLVTLTFKAVSTGNASVNVLPNSAFCSFLQSFPYFSQTPYVLSNSVNVSVVAPSFLAIDFYHTGEIGPNDFFYFVDAYIQYNSNGIYNPACDLNHDGKIDTNDFFVFMSDYISYGQWLSQQPQLSSQQ